MRGSEKRLRSLAARMRKRLGDDLPLAFFGNTQEDLDAAQRQMEEEYGHLDKSKWPAWFMLAK